jgi:ABC-type Fe3+-siderophore transport system permease subunit
MGCAGFGAAIGVHFVVGYVDLFHLLPAFLGFLIFLLAISLLWAGWRNQKNAEREQGDPRSG